MIVCVSIRITGNTRLKPVAIATTLALTEVEFGWQYLPAVLTSNPLNTWISFGVLFVPERLTQPHWLTYKEGDANSRNNRFVYQTLLFRIPTVCTNKSAGVKLWYQNTSGLEEEQEFQRSEQRSSDVLKTNKQRWQDNGGELQVVSCVFKLFIT